MTIKNNNEQVANNDCRIMIAEEYADTFPWEDFFEQVDLKERKQEDKRKKYTKKFTKQRELTTVATSRAPR